MQDVERQFRPTLRVAVRQPGDSQLRGYEQCEDGRHLRFDPLGLMSYFFAGWNPLVYDAFLLAAGIEYCDRRLRRPSLSWDRSFQLQIPVHDVGHWTSAPVLKTLTDAAEFLTGDHWHFDFVPRKIPLRPPPQPELLLTPTASAVLPFSDGLDSLAVAGLLKQEISDQLVLVHLGNTTIDRPRDGSREPRFSKIPYRVDAGDHRFLESSARSRGFKFALLSGIAAFLSGSFRVVLPESGQGAIGPVLVPVGQIYEDYRNHPAFMSRMSRFLVALLGREISFEFPRLWYTKAETLRAYVNIAPNNKWRDTRSCWQKRFVAVDGERRQCGVCAACLLRRMSVHAAGLEEKPTTYVWESLAVAAFADGKAAGFDHAMKANREYGIAGALHLDHLADLATAPGRPETITMEAKSLAHHLLTDAGTIQERLVRMLRQHRYEWESFKDRLGRESFLVKWMAA